MHDILFSVCRLSGDTSLLWPRHVSLLFDICATLPDRPKDDVSPRQAQITFINLIHYAICSLSHADCDEYPNPGLPLLLFSDGTKFMPYTPRLWQDGDRWTLSSSHFEWIADHIQTVLTSDVSDQLSEEGFRNATAEVFLVLSCIPDVATHVDDSRVLDALRWATSRATLGASWPEGDFEFWKSPGNPLFRLHSATLWLINALMGETNGALPEALISDIPDFGEKLCALVSQPPYSDTDTATEKHLQNRDEAFVKIIVKLAGDDMDSWINDSKNHDFVRHWLYVAERCDWGVEYSTGAMSLSDLLRCRNVREPSLEHWNLDFNCVHYVALMAVREEWISRGEPSEATTELKEDRVRPWQLKLSDLISCTLFVMELEIPSLWTSAWYLKHLVDVGSAVAKYARNPDAEAVDELHSLQKAMVTKLDAMLVDDPSLKLLDDVDYDRSAILGEQ